MKEVPSLIKQYEPKTGQIWSHYCSAESFMAITKNKTLRFCDLQHMNDLSELALGEQLLYDVLEDKTLNNNQIATVLTAIEIFKERFVLVSISFSKNGDQLSQWRGYADDAKGFSIGFDAKCFTKLPAHLLKVEYNRNVQKNLIRNAINIIATLNLDNLDANSLNCIAELFELFSMMKNESFAEEKEFRLVRALFIDVDNDGRLFDMLKEDEVYKFYLKDIDFRLVNNTPSPFVDVSFSSMNPIKRVVIGSKNHSTESDISLYLQTKGIQEVSVRKSKSTYKENGREGALIMRPSHSHITF